MTQLKTLLIALLAITFTNSYAGSPESPSLLPEDFCLRLTRLVELAPSGFYEIRGEQNPNPKLPNSKEWFSDMGFSGSTLATVSDVPEMGNYNFKSVWQEGEDFERAISLEKALIERVKDCLTSKGWEVQEVKLPSSATSDSYLFIIHDVKNSKFNNVNIMVSFSDKETYEVSLKVTYSI